ncbi:MAG: TlpA family protein disulfide reductase [Roseivirga sp.]|nr:TlpA family protein disulfide reductase [Roseivirga sp.]
MLRVKLILICLFIAVGLSAQHKVTVDIKALDVSGFEPENVLLGFDRSIKPLPAEERTMQIEVKNLPTLITLEYFKKKKFITHKTFWLEGNSLTISGSMANKTVVGDENHPLQKMANLIESNKKPNPEKEPEYTYSLPFLVYLNFHKTFRGNKELEKIISLAPEKVMDFWAYKEIVAFMDNQNAVGYDRSTKTFTYLTATNKEKEETAIKLTGKPILIDFSSSSCRPCIQDIPKMVEINKTYGDKLDMLTLWDDKKYETWTKVSAKYKKLITWNSLWDEKGAIFQKFDIRVFPNYHLYGADGKLIKKWNRPPKNLDKYLSKD